MSEKKRKERKEAKRKEHQLGNIERRKHAAEKLKGEAIQREQLLTFLKVSTSLPLGLDVSRTKMRQSPANTPSPATVEHVEDIRDRHKKMFHDAGLDHPAVSALIDKLAYSEDMPPNFREHTNPIDAAAPKGHHPELFALLRTCRHGEMPDVTTDTLINYNVSDQLDGLAKQEIYRGLGKIIGTIWRESQAWRGDDPLKLIGRVLGDVRPTVIQPVEQQVDEGLRRESPEFMGMALAQLKLQMIMSMDHFTHEVCARPEIAAWEQAFLAMRKINKNTKSLQMTIAGGMFTAIKTSLNVMQLALEVSVRTHGTHVDANMWQEGIKANRTLVALLASGTNLSSFSKLDTMITDVGDAQLKQALDDHGYLQIGGVEADSYNGNLRRFSRFHPKFFRFVNGKHLDIDASAFGDKARAELRSIHPFTYGCPAADEQVVMGMYDWAAQIAESYLLPHTEQFVEEIMTKTS
ncbi:hypothetical protein EXS70_04270 [Candidatus Peribacteria bacterium]|nr:hypothetical protein [Candidatus Peribacteria bacterium]